MKFGLFENITFDAHELQNMPLTMHHSRWVLAKPLGIPTLNIVCKLKAIWFILTNNAVAVKWYDGKTK